MFEISFKKSNTLSFLILSLGFVASFLIVLPVVFAGGGDDGGGGGVAAEMEAIGGPNNCGGQLAGAMAAAGGNAGSPFGGGNGGGGWSPPPPPPPPPPTPPTFNGSGAGGTGSNISIVNGNTATLSWSCADSGSSSGVNFSTGGATSGSADVSPISTTAYTLLCSNGGQGTVNITVIDPTLSITATPSLLQSGSTSEIVWTTTYTNSCSVSEDNSNFIDSWSGISGTQTTSIIEEQTVYVLACQTDGGPVSESVTVRLVPVFQEF